MPISIVGSPVTLDLSGVTGANAFSGKPTGTSGTDVLIAVLTTKAGSSGVNITPPSGWISIGSKSQVNGPSESAGVSVFWALGSIASLAFTMSGTGNLGGVLMAFRSVDNSTPIDVAGGGDSNVNSSSLAVSSVTVVTSGAWELIGAADYNAASTFSATGFAANQNASVNSQAGLLVNSTGLSTGATGTVTLSDSAAASSNILVAMPFALRPGVNPTLVSATDSFGLTETPAPSAAIGAIESPTLTEYASPSAAISTSDAFAESDSAPSGRSIAGVDSGSLVEFATAHALIGAAESFGLTEGAGIAATLRATDAFTGSDGGSSLSGAIGLTSSDSAKFSEYVAISAAIGAVESGTLSGSPLGISARIGTADAWSLADRASPAASVSAGDSFTGADGGAAAANGATTFVAAGDSAAFTETAVVTVPGYRIYGNDHAGGPVNYSVVIASVSGLTWPTPVLPKPSDSTYAVRAYDLFTGLEDLNTDARVRIVLDSSGNDITSLPNPPNGLSARPAKAGAALVLWAYNPLGQGGVPTGFKVWMQVGALNYALAPTATIPYDPSSRSYSGTLTGLSDGVTYTIGVRAYNATGTESNIATVTVTGAASGPAPVENLGGSAGYAGPRPGSFWS